MQEELQRVDRHGPSLADTMQGAGEGVPLPSRVKFCSSCGTPLPKQQASAKPMVRWWFPYPNRCCGSAQEQCERSIVNDLAAAVASRKQVPFYRREKLKLLQWDGVVGLYIRNATPDLERRERVVQETPKRVRTRRTSGHSATLTSRRGGPAYSSFGTSSMGACSRLQIRSGSRIFAGTLLHVFWQPAELI